MLAGYKAARNPTFVSISAVTATECGSNSGACVDKWREGEKSPCSSFFKNEQGKKAHLPLTLPDKKKRENIRPVPVCVTAL